jgi:anaerobic ribonucleoside-triphosphate reductase activating protein
VPVEAPYTSSPVTEATPRILSCLDVLVDGPFIEGEKDITLRFRGSANQRLIDVPASLRAGEVVLWRDDPVFESHTME